MFRQGLIGVVLQALCGARCIAMTPAAFLQKPMRWLEAMSKYGGTSTFAPNFAYDLCALRAKPEDIERLDLSPWQMALNGAEPIRAQTLEDFCSVFAPCGFRAEAMYPAWFSVPCIFLAPAATGDIVCQWMPNATNRKIWVCCLKAISS